MARYHAIAIQWTHCWRCQLPRCFHSCPSSESEHYVATARVLAPTQMRPLSLPDSRNPRTASTAQSFLRRYGDWLLFAAIVLLAAGLRLAFTSRVEPFVSKDSQSYFLPSWDLIHGNPFVLGLRRTPGYPFFLAGVQLLTGSHLESIVLAQHILGCVTAGAAFLLGGVSFGRIAGVIAGALAALSGPLIIYEHYILTESLFTCTITLSMLALVLALRSPSLRVAFIAGLTLGLSSLV